DMERLDEQIGGTLYKVWKVPGAAGNPAARTALMDKLGVDFQFVHSTNGIQAFHRARDEVRDMRFALECLAAYNTWAANQTAGHTDRQTPVCYVVLDDVDWALGEMQRMRKVGSRMVHIPAQPQAGKSLAHSDFDPVWATAQDLGMAISFHIAFSGSPMLAPGWGNTGTDWRTALVSFSVHLSQLPIAALTALVVGGVFERYPKLIAMAQELEMGWVPYWLEKLDLVTGARNIRRTNYTLPLKPSEYVRRNVFVSNLAPMDTLRPALDQISPDILVFGSDWPHPEGGEVESAIPTYLGQFALDEREKINRFFGDAVRDAMDLPISRSAASAADKFVANAAAST
ncbi:MAG: amidohydrolase family protein, partial [Steroidobacteraceae bacterium]